MSASWVSLLACKKFLDSHKSSLETNGLPVRLDGGSEGAE